MLCSKLATRKDGFQFPCGQCQNCRINKRRDWQARLLLEASAHAYGIFVTLTYADFGVPSVLDKNHAKVFIGCLRKIYPSLRYYLVGEYGTKTGRAHYHVHLFSDVPILERSLYQVWSYGRIHVGDTEPASLDYVLGYLLKASKVLRWPIEEKFPEFRYYSKGLGKTAFPHLLIDGTTLPREFKVFGRTWPIGRYLRDRAKKMGFEVSERESIALERLEAQALYSLLPDGKFTSEEYESAYKIVEENRKHRSELLKKKAIRAAYMEMHGHVQKANKNETF